MDMVMSMAANGNASTPQGSSQNKEKSQLLSIAQGGATAFSVMTTIFQGKAAKREAYAQADLELANSELEDLDARDKKNAIKQRFAEVLGDQTVAFAAAGLRVGSGQAASVAKATSKKANSDLTRAEINRKLRKTGRLANAAALRKRGKTALAQSIIRAGRSIESTIVGGMQRG